MKLSDLTLPELRRRLKKDGIWLQTGVFIMRIQSPVPVLADGLALMYGDYPVLLDEVFADFHVRVDRPRTIRRWFKPQALFFCDSVSAFKPLPLDQAFPMLEWGMNWCVSGFAHSYLMIHAAVVEKGGRAIMLPAPPGSGKSTLCAALVNSGWRLLSDEIALVRIGDGMIVPIPRPVSLKNKSIDIIQRFAPDSIFSRKVFDTTKGTVAHMKPPVESVIRAFEPAMPGWIIFPRYEAGAQTQFVDVPPAHAFIRVADNAFNYSVLGADGFDTLGRLIERTRCFDFTYSALDEAIDTFASLESRSAPT